MDAFLTRSEGEELAGWVKRSEESIVVFITHGHGDHFFGAGPTLAAFPDARLASMPEIAREAEAQVVQEGLPN